MKVLVTGGAGFIGSHLCERILARGEEVIALDNLSTGRLDNIRCCREKSKFRFVQGSAANQDLLNELAQECEIIYHLAAAVGVELIVAEPVQTIQNNLQTSEAVFSAAARFSRCVLLTSSSEVYGKGQSVPFREDDDALLGPTCVSRWSYAVSKTISEHLGLAYHRQYNLPVIVVRLFNTVGPRQTGQYGMVVPRFIQAALKAEDLNVYGSGEQTRCFADVADVVEGLIKLSTEPRALGEVFNLGSDKEISINQLAEKVIAITGSKSRIRRVSYEQAYGPGFEDLIRRRPSLEKIRKLIGYKPQISLDESLARIARQFKSNGQV